MVVDVILLECETRPCDANVSNLQRAFNDPLFSLRLVKSSAREERVFFETVFQDHSASSEPLLVVKDSSSCQLSSKSMSRLVRTALERAQELDIIYLCSWGDHCEKQQDLTLLEDGVRLRTTIGNRATQAVIYRAEARKFLLKELRQSRGSFDVLMEEAIRHRKLKAGLFSPNIVHFDLELATTKENFVRANGCAAVVDTTSTSYIYIWIILLAILLLIVGWCLIQLNPIS